MRQIIQRSFVTFHNNPVQNFRSAAFLYQYNGTRYQYVNLTCTGCLSKKEHILKCWTILLNK